MMNFLVETASQYVEWFAIPLAAALVRQHFRLMAHKEDLALLKLKMEMLEKAADKSEESLHQTEHQLLRIETQLEDWE